MIAEQADIETVERQIVEALKGQPAFVGTGVVREHGEFQAVAVYTLGRDLSATFKASLPRDMCVVVRDGLSLPVKIVPVGQPVLG